MRLLIAMLLASSTLARPSTVRRDDTVILTAEQVSAWTNPAWFASAAYCPGYTRDAWDCGRKCSHPERRRNR